jgi:hypothetical protein
VGPPTYIAACLRVVTLRNITACPLRTCPQCLRTMNMDLVNLSKQVEYGTLGGAIVPTCGILSSNTSGTCSVESENVLNSVTVQCCMCPSRYISSVAAICLVMAKQLEMRLRTGHTYPISRRNIFRGMILLNWPQN